MSRLQVDGETIPPRVAFGPFRFDRDTRELWRRDERLDLQDQPAQVLAALLERPGGLWTRRDLAERIWGDRFAETDLGLNYCIRQIRIVLGDDAESPTYVETLRGRGYRYRGPIPRRVDSAAVGAKGGWAWRMWAGALFGTVAAVWGVLVVGNGRAPRSKTPIVLAVAPMVNLTEVPACSMLTANLTEGLRGELGVERWSQVHLVEEARIRDHDGYLISGFVQGVERRSVSLYLLRVRDGAVRWHGSIAPSDLQDPARRSAVIRRLLGHLTET